MYGIVCVTLQVGGLFLHIGLENGVLTRTEVDRVTGQLSDTRQRFLGTTKPKLFPTMVRVAAVVVVVCVLGVLVVVVIAPKREREGGSYGDGVWRVCVYHSAPWSENLELSSTACTG